ncbi:MAG: polyphosphate kinase [Flavobacteriaceae bacterium]|jgi:polyphosphate kinase
MNKPEYFKRDLSWLSFNRRVLLEAQDQNVPLYERIKFLAIYAANLDEFFEVRVAFINRMAQLNKEKLNNKTDLNSPKKLLKKIYSEVNSQQDLFDAIFRDSLLPSLLTNAIHLYHKEKYLAEHIEHVHDIFYSSALSFIQPIIIRKDELKSSFIENGQLYLVCELEKEDIAYIGIVNIPSQQIGRFFELPRIDGQFHYTFLDDIIKEFDNIIFSGFQIKRSGTIKLNRDAELFLEDDFTEDVAKKISKSLRNREIGHPSRLLHDPELNDSIIRDLQEILSIDKDDCVSGGRYHNMSDLLSLNNPVGASLENEPNPALIHRQLEGKQSLFASIDLNDVLLAFPYQKYGYILRLFNEAAIDPSVTTIKATLYRVASDSHITNALISAAINGKKVEVLVEAKARFDEENNLKWAEKMEKAGVTVIFSTISLKVHSKAALITRKNEDQSITRYAFLGTGNFNEKTAGTYTDYALLTSNKELTSELEDTLTYIIHGGIKENLKLDHLLVAQVNMPERFTELIEAEILNANNGRNAKITLKLNNIQDKGMIDLLYLAADSGVEINLIIRGICCLIPRENIRLIRLVDRYLEHARVYIFHNDGNEKVFIGSADWMGRNLYRRIEIVFPVFDKKIIDTIKSNIDLQLRDNVKAVELNQELENIRFVNHEESVRSQQAFYSLLDIEHTSRK